MWQGLPGSPLCTLPLCTRSLNSMSQRRRGSQAKPTVILRDSARGKREAFILELLGTSGDSRALSLAQGPFKCGPCGQRGPCRRGQQTWSQEMGDPRGNLWEWLLYLCGKVKCRNCRGQGNVERMKGSGKQLQWIASWNTFPFGVAWNKFVLVGRRKTLVVQTTLTSKGGFFSFFNILRTNLNAH